MRRTMAMTLYSNNPTQMWIWRDGAFEPVISPSIFEQARSIIESRHRHLIDQELLDKLRELLRERDHLTVATGFTG
jgi:hypothetical protein